MTSQSPNAAIASWRHSACAARTRLGDPVVGHVQAAEDRLLIDQPQQLGDLRGVEQPRVEPEAARPRPAAVELGPALLGGGDLDAAHGMEGVQRGELLDRPLRQARHRARRVVLEDQPGRVRGRAAGLPQRPLVDDTISLPAALGEMVGDAGAGDAGADDRRRALTRARHDS